MLDHDEIELLGAQFVEQKPSIVDLRFDAQMRLVAVQCSTQETARASLDLYFAHRPANPVVAVIYSHSHLDHFGGVKGEAQQALAHAARGESSF